MLIRVNGLNKQGNGYNPKYLKDSLHGFLFRDENDQQDLGQKKLNLTKTGTVTWSPSNKGLGSEFNNGTDYYTTGAIGSQPPQVWTFETALYLKSTVDQFLMGYQENPGSGTYDRSLRVLSGNIEAYLFDGATKILTGPAAVADKFYHIIASTDGSDFHLTINGVTYASASVSNGGYAGYATPEFIIGYGNTSVSLKGTDHINLYTIVHSKYFTQQEARLRTNNPFKVYEREIFIPIAAAVGGTTIPVFNNHYRNQGIM